MKSGQRIRVEASRTVRLDPYEPHYSMAQKGCAHGDERLGNRNPVYEATAESATSCAFLFRDRSSWKHALAGAGVVGKGGAETDGTDALFTVFLFVPDT